jgi:hypothetical protein
MSNDKRKKKIWRTKQKQDLEFETTTNNKKKEKRAL